MTRLTQNPILGWIDRYRLVAAGLAIVLAISLFGVVGRRSLGHRRRTYVSHATWYKNATDNAKKCDDDDDGDARCH